MENWHPQKPCKQTILLSIKAGEIFYQKKCEIMFFLRTWKVMFKENYYINKRSRPEDDDSSRDLFQDGALLRTWVRTEFSATPGVQCFNRSTARSYKKVN